jgi:hypothetical protein
MSQFLGASKAPMSMEKKLRVFRGCGSVDYAFTIIQQLHLRKSLGKKKTETRNNVFGFCQR